MTYKEVKYIIYDILKYYSNKDITDILFLDELNYEALDWYEIFDSIETELNISIKDIEIEKCNTLYDFVNLIYNISNGK